MSVDYKAKVYYGYLMTPKEIEVLSKTDKYYLFEELELLHVMDHYREPDLYVFGICCESTECITKIDMSKTSSAKMIKAQYERFFGKIDEKPDFYLGLQVL